jgi:chaperonin cofactor prefoldin
VFVNVGALNSKIATLESQIKGLEEELTKLKSQQR